MLRWAGSVGLMKFPLDENQLLARARKDTGLSDLGDDYFLEPMRILINSLNNEANLNPIGRLLSQMNILRLLKHRMYLQDLLKRHPEISQRTTPDPIVVVGLARSGTTRLHRLLASDQRFLHIKSWESVYPVPYPEVFAARDKGETDPRIHALDQGLKAVLYASPQIAAVHPLGTFEVEEEVGLIQHGFSTQIFEIQAKIPTFAEWLMTHDQSAAYQDMALLLKVISWYRGDPEGKPWVLKSPQHMQDLDAMLQVFPNAKLICSHRDPIKAVGSACSMAWNALVRDSDNLTPEWVGQEWLSKTERMLKKTMRVRAQQAPHENQHDIQYADITANWQGAIEDVYDFLGLE